ncbi:MAG: glycosyltransferase family 39 protein [Elusimicrobia bacterium]|nr:glycosyltransferase family 39 protein [Elusimicrobiota bacterium]
MIWIGVAALALRAGAAILTETRPLFPPFYYTDAQRIELLVEQTMAAQKEGRPFVSHATQSQVIQVKTQLALYRLFGPRPLAVKLFHAALGALACVVLGAALLPLFGPGPALAGAALCAVWPSNVFFTSQNFKESPSNLLAYLALWGFLVLIEGAARRAASAVLIGAGVALALTAGAFYRAYTLLILTPAMAAACVLELARRRKASGASTLYLAASLAALALYAPASRWLMGRWTGDKNPGSRALAAHIVPVSWDERARPTSPRGLTEFRRSQLEVDRNWARDNRGREISTQLFPEARFESWLDVAAFLPKGVFHALFMPLPGLYPMEGKIGRVMAGLENLLLLALAGLGVLGALRGPKTSGRVFLMLFFAGMAASAGLLEPDLGSAARHKLLYLPMLFPFAAEQIPLLRR